MSRRILLLLLVLLLAAAGTALLWHRGAATPEGIAISGGDGGGLPRATALEEGFEPSALEASTAQARAVDARALLVMRHGHLVLEHYWGVDAGALVPGGPMGEAAQALLAGLAVRELGVQQPVGNLQPAALVSGIERGAGTSYAAYFSRSLWQPLNASPALLAGDAHSAAQGCCLAARAVDWMRVAGLLLEGGRFEGTQVIPADWVRFMHRPAATDPGRGFGLWLAPAAVGAEPFAAPDVAFLRGPGRTRLWLMPTLALAVLVVGDPRTDADRFDETRVPNLVIRALHDQQHGGAQGLDALVPGH